MKNWQTTLFGIITAICLVFGPHIIDPVKNPSVVSMENLPSALGAFGLGAAAKDNNVTGGDRRQ